MPAEAVANEAGANFISFKGSELLSQHIVDRDTFLAAPDRDTNKKTY